MSGDLILYTPGAQPSVTLVADSSGNVPERGDGLELSGEGAAGPEATAVTSPENLVATLVERPPDFDEDTSYGAGDVVGEATVRVTHYVDWFNDSDGSATAGEQVVHATDGVRAYDNAGGDTADQIVGTVWTTLQKDDGTADKVAVARPGG
jgi:hypothetical protein